MARTPEQVINSLAQIVDEGRRLLEELNTRELAGLNDPTTSTVDTGEDASPVEIASQFIPCTPRSLPRKLLVEAARTATAINPTNAPLMGPMAALGEGFTGVLDPLHIAVLTSKYWGPEQRTLSVSFMEPCPGDLRDRILSHMNAWDIGIKFRWTQGASNGQVRISRGRGGYYSYLGTDCLHIPRNKNTMNLQGFTMSTPESEYKRVVRHETGHTLGAPHEHARKEIVSRLDPQKTIQYFLRTQGWDAFTTKQQVLTPLDNRSIMGTPADQDSCMTYQLPASITKDGEPVRGGADINPTDRAFMLKIYPKAAAGEEGSSCPSEQAAPTWTEEEWE